MYYIVIIRLQLVKNPFYHLQLPGVINFKNPVDDKNFITPLNILPLKLYGW